MFCISAGTIFLGGYNFLLKNSYLSYALWLLPLTMVQHGLIVQTFTHCFGLPIVLLDFLCDLHRKFCEKLEWDNEERDRKDG